MNKKGSFELAGEMVIWLFRIFALLIVVVVLAIMVNAYVKTRVDTSSIEHRIILDKVLMQQGCINFDNEVKQVEYGIDSSRFSSENLLDCLSSSNAGLRLALVYNNKTSEIRYNERMLGYISFCNKNDNFRCSKGRIIVKVLDNGMLYDGLLDYEVITKNE